MNTNLRANQPLHRAVVAPKVIISREDSVMPRTFKQTEYTQVFILAIKNAQNPSKGSQYPYCMNMCIVNE